MIKFVAPLKENGLLIGFGFSEENIRRLKNDELILIKLGELVPDLGGIEILIFVGQDEFTMSQKIKDLIGPETTVKGVFPKEGGVWPT